MKCNVDMAMRRSLLLLVVLFIAGCGGGDGGLMKKWFGGDPAAKPAALVVFKPSATAKVRWHAGVGNADRYVFTPAAVGPVIYAGGANGQIARLDSDSGKQIARIDIKSPISAGVGADNKIIVVGSDRGEVLALDQTGKQLWKTQLTSEVLSAPQIDRGVVIVRSADGRIFALDESTGVRKWLYQRPVPALTVRTDVGVVLFQGAVFAGFPGGKLVALGINTGNVGWESTVALPKGSTELERVADLASLPVHDQKQICAAAYQGRVACVDMERVTQLWSRDISSVSGMAIDSSNVYVTDDKGSVVGFNKDTGTNVWKQDKLFARNVTGPAVVGKYVAVADYQGYVHFLSAATGEFAARIETDGSPVFSQPIAVNDGLLVQTQKGGVFFIAIQ